MTTPPLDRPDFYESVSIEDAATILGKARPTIYAMIARGELHAARFDKQLRVLKDEQYTTAFNVAFNDQQEKAG